ncbi:hypothetical protein Tco_0045488 [Tanacetum coccineum]
MHGHGHPELAKKPNDKIPKTVDKMWKRVKAFIRGETATDMIKAIRSPQWEKSVVASGRLSHLVKDIRQGGQKGKGSAKGKEKVINMDRSLVVVDALIKGFRVRRIHVDGGSSSEVMYEHCFRNLSYRTRSRLKESSVPPVRFSGEVSYPLGLSIWKSIWESAGKPGQS